MMRRFGSGHLRTKPATEETVNPMEGMGNLADVMLVFACGLLLALIINWDVNILDDEAEAESSPVLGEEITEFQSVLDGQGSPLDDGVDYEEMGVVYRDPETGTLYMVITE